MQPNQRLKVIILAGFVFSLILGVRLAALQIWDRDTYTSLARNQHVKRTVLKANRGRILDRHGQALATNLEAQSFFVNNARELDDLQAVAVRFSRRAGEGGAALMKRLQEKRSFVWLARKVMDGPSEDQLPEGVGRIVEMRRTYPMGALAAQVLGYTDPDNRGIEGIEKAFETTLNGRPGELSARVDALGNTLSALGAVHRLPEDGGDLVLTLDADYQSIAEEELKAAVAQFQARSGIAIVMVPQTGEILALANVPLYDPNTFSRFKPWQRRNRAVTDQFEPGSTFKTVAFAGAIETGLVTPDDTVFCENGQMAIPGGIIRDTHPCGWLTVRGVFEESSNIGTVKIARKLGPAKLFRYIRLFGFGSPTGTDLPGEADGQVKHPSGWSRRSLETISIGQEIGATALQVAAAYGAIANGGNLMVPRIFLKAARQDSVLKCGEPKQVRQVITPQTAAVMRAMLEGVVTHGTGTNARVPGYRVAGKTGTAQQVKEGKRGYDPDRYVSSFVGFLPAEQPELLCLVCVDGPQGIRWGSQVAAPVFSRIMQRILSLRHTPLRHRAAVVPNAKSGPAGTSSGSLVGLLRNAAERALARQGLTPRFAGKGTRVVHQQFRPNRKEVLLQMAGETVWAGGPLQVPDVTGTPLRQAIYRLTAAGFRVAVSGSGWVVGQTPRPGRSAEQGTVCRVVCRTEKG